jgi:hypothetical protein
LPNPYLTKQLFKVFTQDKCGAANLSVPSRVKVCRLWTRSPLQARLPHSVLLRQA